MNENIFRILYIMDNEYNNYINIKCHSCLCKISINNLFNKKIIKQNKFYYCSKECYDFI